ncbi:MAG TPA: trigger factor [Planctomycetota bacterium]|jgi:trigger factor|nr:trigger factor [Planctomycetota bacterium]
MAEPFEFTLSDAGPCRKRVRVVVSPERVAQEVEKGYRSISQGVRVPGFRSGRIPRPILEKRFGEALLHELKEDLVQTGFREALRTHELSPLGSPELDLDRVRLEEGKSLEFEIAFDVRPKFDLPEWRGIEVERRGTSVSEAEIDEATSALRQGNRRVLPDPEGAVAADGMVLARVEFFLDGKSLLVRDSVRLSPSTPLPGADPGAFSPALQGRRKGESFDVALAYRSGFEVAEAVGKKGMARVTVLEVYRLVEPTDEELSRALDFPDAAALREDVRARLARHKEEAENRRVEEAVLAELVRRCAFEVPERIVESETEEGVRRLRAGLEAQGVPPEEVGAQVAARQARSREEAEGSIKAWFVLEALARREKIFVTEEEMRTEFQAIAGRNGVPPEEVRRYYEERHDLLGALRAELLERKVRRLLREQAGARTAGTPT